MKDISYHQLSYFLQELESHTSVKKVYASIDSQERITDTTKKERSMNIQFSFFHNSTNHIFYMRKILPEDNQEEETGVVYAWFRLVRGELSKKDQRKVLPARVGKLVLGTSDIPELNESAKALYLKMKTQAVDSGKKDEINEGKDSKNSEVLPIVKKDEDIKK